MDFISKNIEDLIGKEFKESDIQNLPNPLSRKNLDLVDLDEESGGALSEDLSERNMWATSNGRYFPIENTVKKLPDGSYEVVPSMSGWFLRKTDLKTDELIDLPDDATSEVIKGIKEFWSLKDKFNSLKLLHKRGILLYGPQGSGKTSTIMQTVKFMTENHGTSLIVDCPYGAKAGIEMVRAIEPDRNILVVMEDIDSIIRSYGDKTLTSVLDGQDNTKNILFLATTNYPERLPPRLLNRPSRFDITKYIGMPSPEARGIYLKHKMPEITPSELSIWVEQTDSFSIPQLKELIISVLGFNRSLEEAIATIRKMGNILSSGRFEVPGA